MAKRQRVTDAPTREGAAKDWVGDFSSSGRTQGLGPFLCPLQLRLTFHKGQLCKALQRSLFSPQASFSMLKPS